MGEVAEIFDLWEVFKGPYEIGVGASFTNFADLKYPLALIEFDRRLFF